MSVSSGPNSVNSGLVLEMDAINKKCNFLNASNLIDFTTWVSGTNNLPWPSNGDGTQNNLVYDTDPWGNSSLVLKTIPNNTGANGGWEGCSPSYWVNADKGKKYRSCVWVRRISTNTNGTFYHGLHTNGTGDVIQSDNTTQGNPYWACQGIGYMTQNLWYLHVGHIFPNGSTPTIDPTSGYWTISGKLAANPGCNITGSDPRFPSDATLLRNRVYHYYAASDANSNLEFAFPRIDLCDGTEPSIIDILNYSPAISYDLSGNNNSGARVNRLTYSGGAYVFNGSDAWIEYPTSSVFDTQALTMESWCKPTLTAQSGFLFEKGQVNTQYSNFFDSGNYFYFRTIGLSTQDLSIYTPSYITAGAWNHIVCTYGAGVKTIYINGVSVAQQTGLTGTINTGQTKQYIGKYGAATNNYMFNGNIAVSKVYNRALSAEEVKKNFNSLRGRFGL